MGLTQIGGHIDCQLPDGQLADVVAFVNKFLRGQRRIRASSGRTRRTSSDFRMLIGSTNALVLT